MADANIRAVITADDRASAALKGFGDNVDHVGSKIAGVAKVAAVAVAAAGAAAVAFGVASVKAFNESELAISQTEAVLKSTGSVAGVTSEQVGKLATALQKTTRFSDEAIRQGENLLLTFTKIGKDIFPEATETMLNMSEALGQDVKSSAIQLGKALQDPILGITALRRVGVNFSDAQKDVVKNLVDTGRSAEAQKLILKELQIEFGGSAEAAGKTFAGSLAKLKNSFNDVQETVGLTIVNAITPFIQKIAEFVSNTDWQHVLQNIINFFKSIGDAVMYVTNVLNSLFGSSIRALIATFKEDLLPSLQKLYDSLQPALTTVLKVVAQVIGVVIVGAIWLFINALNVIIQVVSTIINVLSNLIGWFGNVAGGAIHAASVIKNAFVGAYQFLKGLNWGELFAGVGRSIANSLIGMIETALKNALKGLPGNVENKINIPRFATGTDFAPGGTAIVGERGPELVNLPRGAQVIPNNKIGSSGPAVNVTFNGIFTGSQMEFRQLAVKLNRALEDAQGMGTI